MFGNQRWRERKHLFRRPDEQIRRENYHVVLFDDDGTPKDFVVKHHYSKSYPAARFRYGLVDNRNGDLVGVAVFSHPTNNKTLTNVFGGAATESVELGRLVLLDEVPGNGESHFVSQCLRHLKTKGTRGVLAFSDPVARTDAEGVMVMPGHVGTVYQALNAKYLLRGTPRTLHVLPDATVFSHRAQQKVRSRERGWEYAAARLVHFGATPIGPDEPGPSWLARWLEKICRPLKHPGNHRYCWFLNGGRAESLAPYPKKGDVA